MTEDPDAVGEASGGGQRRELTARLVGPEMDCPSCAQKVDKSLQRVDGVVDATLQPTTATATVTYDPDRTSEAKVVEAIEAAGYEVVGGSDSEGIGREEAGNDIDIAPPSEVWTSPRAKKTWLGAALVTFGLLVEFLLTTQNVAVASVLAYPLHLADVRFLGAVAPVASPSSAAGTTPRRTKASISTC